MGGVRTVLYNYLFAKKHGGDFILRIEDTDQSRFVSGAEAYIFDCLQWCGLEPDESPLNEGPYGPYRQSERKPMYRTYAEQLVQQGNAYYAFDTPEELEKMRTAYKTTSNPSPQYDHTLRMKMPALSSVGQPAHRSQRRNGQDLDDRRALPAAHTGAWRARQRVRGPAGAGADSGRDLHARSDP